MGNLLEIKDLHVFIDTQPPTKILNGINLSIKKGEVHALMGPNGSGKSTLSLTIMGHPSYLITDGSIIFDGKDITNESVDQRAKKGIFLAFQSPLEIEGVTLRDFLYTARQLPIGEFEKLLAENMALLGIKQEFVDRSLNLGFSGGEKKRAEMLQLAILQPKLAILDEIDSGLDIDALKTICNALLKIKKANPDMAILVITHYPRILNFLIPDHVHVMQKGSIIESGTKDLALEIEREGYQTDAPAPSQKEK